MGSMSDDLETKIMKHILGGNTGGNVYTPLATVYIALFTAAPSDTGGGTEVGTARGYARVSVANTSAQWTTTGANPASTSNVNTVTFGTPVTTDWGTVTHFGIMTSSGTGTTAADFLYWGALASSKLIKVGDGAPSFAAGALVATQD